MDEILNLIESVSEGIPTLSCHCMQNDVLVAELQIRRGIEIIFLISKMKTYVVTLH